MSLTLLSPPIAEPVTLQEMKDHLRVTTNDEDTLINGYLVAAVRAVEARGCLALMVQQWRLTLDTTPSETITLPLAPVSAIDAVKVVNGQGAAINVATSAYEFAPGSPGKLRPAAPWPQIGPRIGGVSIDFTAGYANAGAVPEPLKHAVKLLAAFFFESREAAGEKRIYGVPQSVDALIAPYREPRL